MRPACCICARRALHSDVRQVPWHRGNVRIAANADRPITPVKGSGQHQALRRRMGTAASPHEVVRLIRDALADGGGVDTATVAAAIQRAGELRSWVAVNELLAAPVDATDTTYAGIVLTALARCAAPLNAFPTPSPLCPPAPHGVGDDRSNAGGDCGPPTKDAILTSARAVWQRVAVPSAPMYGAALSLCARVGEVVWAGALWAEVAPMANVMHMGCYMRVLAGAGRWDEVLALWTDGDTPCPNASCLAGIVAHATTLDRLRELWTRCTPDVEITPSLLACAMRCATSLGAPGHALSLLEEHAPPIDAVDAIPHVMDRFGTRRYVLDAWVCAVRAHTMLYESTRDTRHARAAVEVAQGCLRPHVVARVPAAATRVFYKALDDFEGLLDNRRRTS